MAEVPEGEEAVLGQRSGTETAGVGFQKESRAAEEEWSSGHPCLHLPGRESGPGPRPAWRLGTGRARRARAGERVSRGLRPPLRSTVTGPDASAGGLDRDQGRRSTEDCSIRTPQRQQPAGPEELGAGAPWPPRRCPHPVWVLLPWVALCFVVLSF